MTASVLAFPHQDSRLRFICRRRAEEAKKLQAALAAQDELERRREQLIDLGVEIAAAVERMTPDERIRRAREIGILDDLYRGGFPPFDGAA